MKKFLYCFLLVSTFLTLSCTAKKEEQGHDHEHHEPSSKQAATTSSKDKLEEISLLAEDGKTYKMADFKDSIVVLEWFNAGCPYVQKHYMSANMQKLQSTYTRTGKVTWLTIASSAEGKQGHIADAAAAKKIKTEVSSQATHLIVDEGAKLARLLGAQVTPHMMIYRFVDKKWKRIYSGAIDSVADTNIQSIPQAIPYVAMTLKRMIAGETVAVSENNPYGCPVKY